MKEIREIIALTKIHAGDEICVNYIYLNEDLKNLKSRQQKLMTSWGFKCECDLCEEEKITSDDTSRNIILDWIMNIINTDM